MIDRPDHHAGSSCAASGSDRAAASLSQSISPAASAFAAVAGVGNDAPLDAIHQHAVAARGEAGRLRGAACSGRIWRTPRGCRRHIRRARNGTGRCRSTSGICLNGSVVRQPLRHDHRCAAASSPAHKAARRTASSAGRRASCRPAPPAHRAAQQCVWPIASRFIQRCSEATQSRASTGVPSWNSSPSRSRIVQRRPSFST